MEEIERLKKRIVELENRPPEIRYIREEVPVQPPSGSVIVEQPEKPKIETKVEQEYEEEFEVIERVAVDVGEKKYDLTNEKN